MENDHPFAIRPLTWNLTDTHWPQLDGKPMVFVEQYQLLTESALSLGVLDGATIYVFGGRVYVGDQSDGPHFRIHYAVVQHRPDFAQPLTTYLKQDDSVFFASDSENAINKTRPRNPPDSVEMETIGFGSAVGSATMKLRGFFLGRWEFLHAIHAEYVQAGAPKKLAAWLRERLSREFQVLKRRPRWSAGEGTWPFFAGRPMIFVDQTPLNKNEVTRTRLSFDWMIYVFIGTEGDRSDIKIYGQQMNVQTAEQHYLLEAMIDDFLRSPRDETIVRRCIEKGDRYLHEFLLEQSNLSDFALALLAKQGSNKEIRTAAAKRLAKH